MPALELAALLLFAAAKKDCGTDLNCFIKAAKGCEPAQVRNTVTLDLMGMMQKTTTLFRIDGTAGGKCKVLQTVEKAEAHLEGKALKSFKEQHPEMTAADIRKGEANQNKTLQGLVGKVTECRMANKALADAMTHVRDGVFSTEDWAGCSAK